LFGGSVVIKVVLVVSGIKRRSAYITLFTIQQYLTDERALPLSFLCAPFKYCYRTAMVSLARTLDDPFCE
jgi:hypothetical protein